MAMKILLVTVLQSFKIDTDLKFEDIELKRDIIVSFKGDIYPIKLLKR